MKKNILTLFFIILFVFIVTGCSNDTKNDIKKGNNVEKQKETYIKYVQKLEKIQKSTEDIPFSVDVTYDKLDDEEVRFQVIIDNPTIDMKKVKALAIHNKQTDDVFPSVGIFDDSVDLIKDSEEAGIILVGYIPYEGNIEDFCCEMKILVSYELEEKNIVNYYVTKN